MPTLTTISQQLAELLQRQDAAHHLAYAQGQHDERQRMRRLIEARLQELPRSNSRTVVRALLALIEEGR